MVDFVKMGARTEVHKRGPWFNGRWRLIVHDFEKDWAKDTTDHGKDLVQRNLHERIKHPTGYYESHVRAVRRGTLNEVTDGGVVYGPWLEGEGSRNFPVTRFRGYHSFRKAANKLERVADNIGERLFRLKYKWRLQ